MNLNLTLRKWEDELGHNLTDDYWEEVLKLVHSSSICARHAVIQAKVVFRSHFTRHKLSRIYSDVPDTCLRCGLSPANHLHTFVTCPRLHSFWSGIIANINTAYHCDVILDPCLAIFGVSPQPVSPHSLGRVLAFTTLLARRLILMRWKDPLPPPLKCLFSELLLDIRLEKLRFTLRGSSSAFESTWGPMLRHLEVHFPPRNSDDLTQ